MLFINLLMIWSAVGGELSGEDFTSEPGEAVGVLLGGHGASPRV